jgi:hypothetical protein
MAAEAKRNVVFQRRGKFRRLEHRAASDFRCDRLMEVTTDITDPNLATAFNLEYSRRQNYEEILLSQYHAKDIHKLGVVNSLSCRPLVTGTANIPVCYICRQW